MTALAGEASIGEIAARSGLSTSALRFYEDAALISARRTSGNQRRYPRSVLRRLAFIRAAQRVGMSLDDIRTALSNLPTDRAPTRADWQRLGRSYRTEIDIRIATLERLRDQLTSCIGCGCLSLRTCALSNPDDTLVARGRGVTALLPAGSARVQKP